MTTAALFLHVGREEAVSTGRDVARWLLDRGVGVVASADELSLLDVEDCSLDGDGRTVDIVISVGGDGTMLRAARRAVAADAELLGINLGRLGYLAEVEPGAWEAALDTYLAGGHSVTERMLVSTSAFPADRGTGDPVELPPGLNEIVIEKLAMGRTVELSVAIDGQHFTTYHADGIIIATPTGSTAYSLSARGPVVAPSHRALVVTAVSPHSLFDRSLVLEPSSVVEVAVCSDRIAAVAVDGEHQMDLRPGSRVRVTADERPARFVTFGDRNFHQILKAKFGLSER
ncbi:MAG: NAD(+)/NADH kinase [Acidimicrobiales bacterium]|nr:NAD(+)/NADH kinase [Acidimicrobiales bacterium]